MSIHRVSHMPITIPITIPITMSIRHVYTHVHTHVYTQVERPQIRSSDGKSHRDPESVRFSIWWSTDKTILQALKIPSLND